MHLRRLAVPLAILLLLALGLRPFLPVVELWPMAPDSGPWIERGASDRPGWSEWVFGRRHFRVGYRPLTALSYTAGHAIGGYAAWIHRWMDLATHAAAALGVYALARVLEPKARRGRALLAMAAFLALPCSADVAPMIERRAYSLSTALALFGLALGCRAARRAEGSVVLASAPAALCTAGAFLSHEAGILAVLVLPLLAWSSGEGRWRRALLVSVVPLLLAAGALALRTWIVGGIGGYADAQDERATRAGAILAASFRSFLALRRSETWLAWLTLGLAAAAIALGRRERRNGALLLVWLAATAALFAGQGVWYDRQAYALAAPAALAFALTLHASSPARRLPALALAALILSRSPVVHGLPEGRLAGWREKQVLLEAIHGSLADVREPATVHLVLPFTGSEGGDEGGRNKLRGRDERNEVPRRVRSGARWIETLLGDREVSVNELAYVRRERGAGAPYPTVETTGARAAVVVPEGEAVFWHLGGSFGRREAGASRRIPIPSTRAGGGSVHVFLYGAGGGELVTVVE